MISTEWFALILQGNNYIDPLSGTVQSFSSTATAVHEKSVEHEICLKSFESGEKLASFSLSCRQVKDQGCYIVSVL